MRTQLSQQLSEKWNTRSFTKVGFTAGPLHRSVLYFTSVHVVYVSHDVYSYMELLVHEHTSIHSVPWLQLLLLICHPFSIPPSRTNSTWTAHAGANPTLWHLHLECFRFIKSSQHCGKFTFPKSPLERRLKWWSTAGQGENKSKLKGAHLSARLLSWKPYCVKM